MVNVLMQLLITILYFHFFKDDAIFSKEFGQSDFKTVCLLHPEFQT